MALEDADESRLSSILHFLEVSNWMAFFVLVWIIPSVIIYGNNKGKWKKTAGGKLYLLCFLSMVLALPKLIQIGILFHISEIPGGLHNCEIAVDIENVFAALAYVTTYLFLWCRQRYIHQKVIGHRISGRWVQFFSWAVLVCIGVAFFGLCLGYTVPRNYTFNGHHCSYIPGENMTVVEAKWHYTKSYVLAASSLLLEVMLLCLLIYSLITVKNRQARLKSSDKSDTGLRRVILRCTIATSVTIVTHLICVLSVLDNDYPVVVVHSLASIDVFVANICILSTFRSAKKILTVMLPCNLSSPNRRSAGGIRETEGREEDPNILSNQVEHSSHRVAHCDTRLAKTIQSDEI